MFSLLRADFFRMWKSKSTIIGLIVACAGPFLINLLYLGIDYIIIALDGESSSMVSNLINARTVIGQIYNTGNNMALIIPMFSAIFICSDISSGMLRNKIIAGKPRSQIFFSYLICAAFINLMLITAYASLMTGLSLLMFKYGPEIGVDEVINLVYYFVSGTVAFLFLSTASLFFSLTTGNSALSIIFTLLFSFGLGVITTLIGLLNLFDIQGIEYFMSAIPTYTSQLQTGGVDNTITFIEGFFSMIAFGALNIVLAYQIFTHKELK